MFFRCMIEAGDQGHRCFHDVAWTTYAYAEIMGKLDANLLEFSESRQIITGIFLQHTYTCIH
jgi:hypothetical protein